MIFGLSGVRTLRLVYVGRIVGLVAPLRLAALPFLEEVCYASVVGVWEVELLAPLLPTPEQPLRHEETKRDPEAASNRDRAHEHQRRS